VWTKKKGLSLRPVGDPPEGGRRILKPSFIMAPTPDVYKTNTSYLKFNPRGVETTESHEWD
jgi:hypothetical protein